jgi:hypothetical protein
MGESGTAGEQEAVRRACFGDRGSRCDGAPACGGGVGWACVVAQIRDTAPARGGGRPRAFLGKTIGWTRTRLGRGRDF